MNGASRDDLNREVQQSKRFLRAVRWRTRWSRKRARSRSDRIVAAKLTLPSWSAESDLDPPDRTVAAAADDSPLLTSYAGPSSRPVSPLWTRSMRSAAATGTGAVSTGAAAETDVGPKPVGGVSGLHGRSAKCDGLTQRLVPQM